jgi:putative ABC transport system substrate-binding protein
MIDRRTWLRLAAGGLLPAGRVALPQALSSMPARVGFVASVPFSTWVLRGAFVEAMRERGWIEGPHYTMDAVSYDGHSERVAVVTAELVQRRPAVIVCGGTPPIAPLMKLTSTIPIVFVGAGDPVASGFVASLARPGGNVTGIAGHDHGLLTKQLELLMRAAPRVRRVALVYNPDFRVHVAGRVEVEAAARELGVQVLVVEMRSVEDIAKAAAMLQRERVEAVHFFGQPFQTAQRERLAALMLEHRWPAVSGFEEDVRAGMLLFYGWRRVDAVRRVPYYIDRILNGTPPSELPVEQPSRLYLTLNRRTARALGLTLPPSLLMQATEVVD